MQSKTLGSPGVLLFVGGCGMLAETKGWDHMKRKWDWKNAAMGALLFGMGMALGLAEWETKEMHQFRKQMADFLSVLRTEYAAALHAGDAQAAERFRERFEQRSKNYPYPAEVQSERELLELLSQN